MAPPRGRGGDWKRRDWEHSRPGWERPFWWTQRKFMDHPAVVTGAIIGGIIGSVLGPIGTIAGAGAGGAIGNNLDQPPAEDSYEDEDDAAGD